MNPQQVLCSNGCRQTEQNRGEVMGNFFDNIFNAVAVVALGTMNGTAIRDEVTAWVSVIGSIAITLTTIGLQIYRLIRDRDKKNNNTPDGEEEKNSEHDERKR